MLARRPGGKNKMCSPCLVGLDPAVESPGQGRHSLTGRKDMASRLSANASIESAGITEDCE